MIDQKVKTHSTQLNSLGISHTVVEHPELKTPIEVQSFLGLSLKDGLSTMVMKADKNYVAVIRRDDCQMNFTAIKKILGVKDLRIASDTEFTKITGLEPGTAQVFLPVIKKTFLDTKLFEIETLTGGSGSFFCSLRYKSEDLKKIPGSIVVDIASVKEEQKSLSGKRILSGITPSGDGTLHIGNYLGAVKQFIEMARQNECLLFVADLHALTTVQSKTQLQNNVEALILNELALLQGFLTKQEFDRLVFFRQSDIGLHPELQTILNNVTPLGLLKRAHAYKDKLQKETLEEDINLGLFNYPILMAADILMYRPDLVPVGKDQKQHIEITRDIAQRFNKTFKKNVFPLPDAYIPQQVAAVLGTDGKRKMSKSLGNIISIFESEEIIKKQIMGTYTDPTRIHAADPGHIEGNMVFTYLDFFGNPSPSLGIKLDELKQRYVSGQVSDVEVKNYLYETLINFFAPARIKYEELEANPQKVKEILKNGRDKALRVAQQTMKEVREAVGLVNSYTIVNHESGIMNEAGRQGKITIDEFGKVEIRVGKVEQAENVEKSEKLIRLHVDFAQFGKRIIFTGVRGYGYQPEDFSGKQFFFVVNLEPKKMLGEDSQGMILAVDSPSQNSSGEVSGLRLGLGGHGGNKPIFVSAEGMPIGAKIR